MQFHEAHSYMITEFIRIREEKFSDIFTTAPPIVTINVVKKSYNLIYIISFFSIMNPIMNLESWVFQCLYPPIIKHFNLTSQHNTSLNAVRNTPRKSKVNLSCSKSMQCNQNWQLFPPSSLETLPTKRSF